MPRLDVLDDLLIGRREPASIAQEISRRNRHPVPLDELRLADDLTDPYLRSLNVLHHRHVAARLLRRLAHQMGVLEVRLVLTVAEVQPRHVHPEVYEVPDGLFL